MPKRASQRKPARSVARTPNLLITIQERHREVARAEVGKLLKRIGVRDFKFSSIDEGILGVRLSGDDPKACVARLGVILREDPVAFQHTHRWIPIEAWVRAERAELERFGDKAQAGIGEHETWKIELHRHHSSLDRDLMINSVAGGIDNPHVDLNDAEKTVALEVVGEKAALSVLEPAQRLSVDRILKDEFVKFEEVG